MATIARLVCGLLVVGFTLVCVPAFGQAELPPSAVPLPGTVPGPGVTGPAPPIATFDGTIQPPPATWDPYATPGSAPPALVPMDPSYEFGPPVLPGPPVAPTFSFTTMRRFLDEVRFDYVWMPGSGEKGFGINDLELSGRFAIPLLYNIETPLLVTPGFAIHYWNGPEPWYADLPSRVYDAYLDAAWNPQMTPWLGGELSFRVGVYSDFQKVTSESVRYMGKGMLVLTFTPSIQVKAGAWYLDRNHVKVLPAGGIVWTPNPDVRFEILFPNPKIATRLTNFGSTEWWLYARGEYGGGAWTVDRSGTDPALIQSYALRDSVDYNDLRCSVGLEFVRPGGLTGLFEVGMAFEREIRFKSEVPVAIFYPDATVFLRAGLAY